MSVYTVMMKTHSREKLKVDDQVNNCIVHNCKPEVFKIIFGRKKYVYYVAFCKSDDCTRMGGESKENIVSIWNKWNPNEHNQ